MKFEHTEVWGFKHAMRGMRNPKESWAKNDTVVFDPHSDEALAMDAQPLGWDADYVSVGPNDMKLATSLIRGGSEHRKFLRQIFVSVDITAPLYWWKEFDTYKVGTVANSTSTMHKLTSKPITLDCFETDDYDADFADIGSAFNSKSIIDYCEELRLKHLQTNDKRYWKELIRWLPESWLQTRTVTMNYENIYSMVWQRRNHKLNEWSGIDKPDESNFISWARSLPYAQELIFAPQEI